MSASVISWGIPAATDVAPWFSNMIVSTFVTVLVEVLVGVSVVEVRAAAGAVSAAVLGSWPPEPQAPSDMAGAMRATRATDR